jgi:hypothetical protein
MTPAPDTKAGNEINTPALRKKNGVSSAKEIDRMRSRGGPIPVEDPRDHQARHVRGEHRLAARPQGERTQAQDRHQKELDLGLAHAVSEGRNDEPGCGGEQGHRGPGHHDEHDQHRSDVGEESPQREDGAEVGHEASGQDELAELPPIQARLDHDGVHDGDRRGAEGDAADLRRMQGPSEDPEAEREGSHEGQEKRNEPDRQARLPVAAQRHRVVSAPARNVSITDPRLARNVVNSVC